MNYFSENMSDFSDLYLKIENKITLRDKKILEKIFNIYEENKDELVKIELQYLYTEFKFTKEDILEYFGKLMRKRIQYSFKNLNNQKINGAFYLFASYSLTEQHICILLPKEIQFSFEKNNFFRFINLNSIFKFKSNHTLPIHLKLLNSFDPNIYNQNFSFSLEELRKLLTITNSYDRFYDFEKKVLIPIIDDLNNHSNFEVKYVKLKNGEGKSSRIIGINFICINKIIKQLKENSNSIISKIKNKITDFDYVYKIIVDYLKIYDYKYVYNNAVYAFKYHKKISFENYLNNALKGNFYQLYTKNKPQKIVINKEIYSIRDLYNEILSLLNQAKLSDLTTDNNFLSFLYRHFYQLVDKKIYKFTFPYINTDVKIEVIYSTDSKTKIILEKTKKDFK